MSENWVLIGKGKSGWHASAKKVSTDDGCSSKASSSSYDATDVQLNKYSAEAEEGAYVYDASKADTVRFSHFVISGPMVDVDLAPGEVSRFGELRKTAKEMCGPGGLQGAFRDLAMMAVRDEKFSGLDAVSLDVYFALLAQIPGVRFGRVKNGRVEWDL